MNFQPMDDYSEARSVDKRLQEFFGTCNFYLRQKIKTLSGQNQRIDGEHREMMNLLNKLKNEVHERMCDNFDFPGVFKAILSYCK